MNSISFVFHPQPASGAYWTSFSWFDTAQKKSVIVGPRTILVIDDDPYIRDVVAQTLTDEEYDVITCGDGQIALDMFAHQKPGLILLDLMMPTISGWEMIARFKTMPHMADVPVILLSASRSLDQTARDSGVAAHIAKPFDLDLLVQTVARYLKNTTQNPDDDHPPHLS